MILKDTLRSIVKAQREELGSLEYGIKREMFEKINPNIPFAIILSGIRRCGKSTLLRQVMSKQNDFYYFNFEDPRATSFEVGDFNKLMRFSLKSMERAVTTTLMKSRMLRDGNFS